MENLSSDILEYLFGYVPDRDKFSCRLSCKFLLINLPKLSQEDVLISFIELNDFPSYLSGLKALNVKIDKTDHTKIAALAARAGVIELIPYIEMQSHYTIVWSRISSELIRYGKLDMLKWLSKTGRYHLSSYKEAIENKQLEIIEWMLECGIYVNSLEYVDSIDVLECFLSSEYFPDVRSILLITNVAKGNRVELLDYLLEHEITKPIIISEVNQIVLNAVECEAVDILEWVREKIPSYKWNIQPLYKHSIINGAVESLKHLYKMSKIPIHNAENAVYQAVKLCKYDMAAYICRINDGLKIEIGYIINTYYRGSGCEAEKYKMKLIELYGRDGPKRNEYSGFALGGRYYIMFKYLVDKDYPICNILDWTYLSSIEAIPALDVLLKAKKLPSYAKLSQISSMYNELIEWHIDALSKSKSINGLTQKHIIDFTSECIKRGLVDSLEKIPKLLCKDIDGDAAIKTVLEGDINKITIPIIEWLDCYGYDWRKHAHKLMKIAVIPCYGEEGNQRILLAYWLRQHGVEWQRYTPSTYRGN